MKYALLFCVALLPSTSFASNAAQLAAAAIFEDFCISGQPDWFGDRFYDPPLPGLEEEDALSDGVRTNSRMLYGTAWSVKMGNARIEILRWVHSEGGFLMGECLVNLDSTADGLAAFAAFEAAFDGFEKVTQTENVVVRASVWHRMSLGQFGEVFASPGETPTTAGARVKQRLASRLIYD